MPSDSLKTSILYSVYNGKVFKHDYDPIELKAIGELLDDGYLRLVMGNLQLTNKAQTIVRFNRDYETRLERETIIEQNIPPKRHHKAAIQKGIGVESKWKSEFTIGFVYAILALLIGTILLKMFGVI
jgi:hypothetical protein